MTVKFGTKKLGKEKSILGITAYVPDLQCTNTASESDYGLVLNGKHVKSVSKAGLYFPYWRFETLQGKKKRKKKENQSSDVINQC